MAKAVRVKLWVGGRRCAMLQYNPDWGGEAEVIGSGERPEVDGNDRTLLVELMHGGEVLARPTLEAARAHHKQSLAELPPRALQLSRGEPAIPTIYEGGHP